MNIYKYALDMEKDGEDYYNELVTKTENIGLKNIFKMLANEEVKHHKFLEKLSANDEYAELGESDILSSAKNIFSDMGPDMLNLNTISPQTELYKKARDVEVKSYNFFLERSKEAKKDSEKLIFLKLAKEEKKHLRLLDNIVDFVSRPENWIENAEFNHMDEY